MSLLHIVNKSPYERGSLDTCLRLAKADSSLLLIEDGVYAVLAVGGAADTIAAALDRHRIYALRADIEARGIDADRVIDGVSLVDYDDFVRLTTEHDRVQSWL